MKANHLLMTALLAAAAATLLPRCSKKDVEFPAPTAAFTVLGATGTTAPALLSFSNKSTGATSYTWDFGDGTATVSETSPSHVFSKGGVFTVRLTARSGGGATATTAQTVTVGTPTAVRIIRVAVPEMQFLNVSSLPWDGDGSGPDVYFTLLDAADAVVLQGSVLTNLSPASLPLSWMVNPSFLISNLSQTYKLRLYDYDTALSSDFIAGYQFSFGANFNNSTGYPTTATLWQSGSNAKIELSLQWQ